MHAKYFDFHHCFFAEILIELYLYFFYRGHLWYLFLAVLHIFSWIVCDTDEPNSQVVSYVLWTSFVGLPFAGLAHHSTTKTSSYSSCIST